MKSLNNYSKNNIQFTNSIQCRIENPIILEEYALVAKHGKYIDSVFEKLSTYKYRISNPNYINESDKDIYFVFEEQMAIRDILLSIANSYQHSLIREFCNEYNIKLENDIITEGFDISSMTNSLSKTLNGAGDTVKQAFQKMKGVLSAVKEFMMSVINKVIKTAKDLFNKFTDMMIQFGGNVKDLINKLTNNNADEYKKTFFTFTKQIAEVESKDGGKGLNTFESLAHKINSGEQITEEYLADVFPIYEDEYSDAANAKAGKKKKGMNPILQALLQMAAYHLTVTIIPAVITVASGGTLGWLASFIHDIAAVAWGSIAFYKQCKHIAEVLRSKEFKSRTLFYKIITVLWWLFCLTMSAIAIAKGANNLFDKIKHLAEGGKLAHILPPEDVMKWVERLNDLRKNWFGKTDDLKALDYYKEMLGEKEMLQFEKDAEELLKAKSQGGENFDATKTNQYERWEKEYGKEAAEWLKKNIVDREDFTIGKNSNIWKEFSQLRGQLQSDEIIMVVDSTAKSVEGIRAEIASGMQNMDNTAVTVQQISNTAVHSATNGNYGTAFLVTVKVPPTADNIERAEKLVNGVLDKSGKPGHCTPLSAIQKLAEPIKVLVGDYIGFAGLMPIVQKSMRRGGFKMRLGSGRTKGHVYLIPDSDYVQGVPYSKFVNEYMDKNPKAIKEMQKYFNQNIELAVNAKEKLESKEKLNKEEKKKLKAITNFIERSKEGKSEFEVIVFNTNDKYAIGEFGEPKRKSKKEVKEALVDCGFTDDEVTVLIESLEFDADGMINIDEGIGDLLKAGKEKVKGAWKATKEKIGDVTHKLKYGKDASKEDIEKIKQEDEKEKERRKKAKNGENTENTEDDLETGEQYPIMFFNPLILCGGDLAPRERTKGPRAHIYMAKGLLSRLEFFPIDKGMSAKEIYEMFADMLKEGLKACYDVTYDVPCYKDGRKFVQNKDSQYGDKERMDFGGLTNKQITDFMNNNKLANDYLGGDFATDTISGGKHQYIEQADTPEKKEHNEKVVDEFRQLILNNDEVKDYIKSTKTLSKALYNKDGSLNEKRFSELIRSFLRVENTYLKGDDKHGFLKKIKNIFSKEIEFDPSEVKQLSLLFGKVRKKQQRKKVKESFGEEFEYNNLVFEANIELIETEFDDLWNEKDYFYEEFNYIDLVKRDED